MVEVKGAFALPEVGAEKPEEHLIRRDQWKT
jgi:hypothetical protein